MVLKINIQVCPHLNTNSLKTWPRVGNFRPKCRNVKANVCKKLLLKYLGVIIDIELTWKAHIDYVYSKLLKFIGIFCFNVLKSLYFAFVDPHLLYGIEVYGNSSLSHLNKLIIFNNKLLRIVQNKSLRTPVIELYRNF